MIRRVAHTGFTVSDLDRAVALWCEGLGFTVERHIERGPEFCTQVLGVPGARLHATVVGAGGHSVELLQYDAPDGRDTLRPRPCDVGSVHLAVEVDDVAATVERLRAFGCTPAGTPQDDGTGRVLVYVRDPDGVTIELIRPAG